MRATPCVAAAVGTALLAGGCGALRDGAVRPSVNDCVAALPVAKGLVGSAATLRELRRVSLPDTQTLLTRIGSTRLTRADGRPGDRAPSPSPFPSPSASSSPPSSPPGPGGPPPSGAATGARPCVFVFSGSFTAAGLTKAPGLSGAASGGYVVLVTTTRHPRVLRTVVTGSDPLR